MMQETDGSYGCFFISLSIAPVNPILFFHLAGGWPFKAVCGLVLYKTACSCRMNHSLVVRTLRRDGCAYFLCVFALCFHHRIFYYFVLTSVVSVIFAANLSWLVMTFRAPVCVVWSIWYQCSYSILLQAAMKNFNAQWVPTPLQFIRYSCYSLISFSHMYASGYPILLRFSNIHHITESAWYSCLV